MEQYIASTANQQVKNACELKQKKAREERGLFLVEGNKMLAEAASAGLLLRQLFVEQSRYEAERAFYDGLGAESVFTATESVIAKLSEWKTPQGSVGVVTVPEADWQSALAGNQALAVVLDGVSDPGNVGTIVRTAEACGVDVIFTTKGTADCFQAKALRASMGSAFRVAIREGLDPEEVVALCRAQGLRLIATSLQGEELAGFSAKGPKNALVFGSEGSGISACLAQNADVLLRLPMAGRVESLNVAVSAGILMYRMFELGRN